LKSAFNTTFRRRTPQLHFCAFHQLLATFSQFYTLPKAKTPKLITSSVYPVYQGTLQGEKGLKLCGAAYYVANAALVFDADTFCQLLPTGSFHYH